MIKTTLDFLRDYVPLFHRIERLPRQLLRISPFRGDLRPSRVLLFHPGSGRPTLPFPHPWNYQEPIRILETYFWGADEEEGDGRHNRYLEVPGFPPVYVTRDPRVIRAIASDTGARPGQFDRDTMPSKGIARATGKDTLLFANGSLWKLQKKLAAPPFGKTSLFQPEQFHEFADSFRDTARKRLAVLRELLKESGPTIEAELETEIKAVMLEMLANNFFGAEIAYEEIREKYVPALEQVIDFIVRDTVMNRLGIPIRYLPPLTRGMAQARKANACFEELTDLVLEARKQSKGLWRQFKSDAPDRKLRSNLKVFLAGALEATTSYASWAVSHLARHPEAQEKVYEEVRHIDDYTPESLAGARYLGMVLDETLRLTPSLYFLPRRATADTWIEIGEGRKMMIPRCTHILLDVWHANRHDDHWGVEVSGHPAEEFVPERWENLPEKSRKSSDSMHFGFGFGPRVCPGKHLGQLEVGLVVGAIVKLFRFEAVHPESSARAGVSTKPADGALVKLELRE